MFIYPTSFRTKTAFCWMIYKKNREVLKKKSTKFHFKLFSWIYKYHIWLLFWWNIIIEALGREGNRLHHRNQIALVVFNYLPPFWEHWFAVHPPQAPFLLYAIYSRYGPFIDNHMIIQCDAIRWEGIKTLIEANNNSNLSISWYFKIVMVTS